MSDLKYRLGFNIVKGIGPAKMKALQGYFGDFERAWHATELELNKIGVDRRTIRSFLETRQTLDLDAAMAKVDAANITLITWDDPAYPTYIRNIPGSPPLLYVAGNITEADRWAVAIVGTRRLTSYGRQIARDLTIGLVNNGVTIISGLARGIDAVAHKTAVEMGGRTIAVLGSGVDSIYPAEHRGLAKQIANGHGAVISEYGMGVRPEAKNFPPRNRVISGLSLGTIVIEAGIRSGALITSKFAMEQGREVFAVPGSINSPVSKGPNKLIQQGAKLVTCVEDVLEELNISMVVEKTAVQLALPSSKEEAALLPLLSHEPTHVDELSRKSGMAANKVSGTLTLMELKGMVKQMGRMNYALA